MSSSLRKVGSGDGSGPHDHPRQGGKGGSILVQVSRPPPSSSLILPSTSRPLRPSCVWPFNRMRFRYMLFIGVFSLMLISQMHRSTSSVFVSWSRDDEHLHHIGSRPSYTDAQQQQRSTTTQTIDIQDPRTSGASTGSLTTSSSSVGIIPAAMYKPSTSRPVPVRFVGRHVLSSSWEDIKKKGTIRVDANSTSDLLWDAVERSPFTQVVQSILYDPSTRKIKSRIMDASSNATTSALLASGIGVGGGASRPSSAVSVTLVDWASLERDCHALRQALAKLPKLRGKNMFVYWDTTNSPAPRTCDLEESVRSSFDSFHYVQRSVVEGRRWNQDVRWIVPGQRWVPPAIVPSGANLNGAAEEDATALVSPAVTKHPIHRWFHEAHPLREMFVQQLTKVADPVRLEYLPTISTRATPVSFFIIKGNTLPYSFFRERVSSTVGMLAMERKIKYLVDEVEGARRDAVTHEQVPSSYVRALLESKIVVIASHDEWEGHWRLWESMASGALVFSEAMVAPPQGLQNGTNIILYDSYDSLRRLLVYYLDHGDERRKIAQRGQQLALGLHRTWHGLERVLFGQALTAAHDPFARAPKRRHG